MSPLDEFDNSWALSVSRIAVLVIIHLEEMLIRQRTENDGTKAFIDIKIHSAIGLTLKRSVRYRYRTLKVGTIKTVKFEE
jgi:hypothetical protein